MTHLPVPHKTLIVVGTGEGAKFYRNTGKNGELKLQHSKDLEPGDLADQGPAGKQPPDTSAFGGIMTVSYTTDRMLHFGDCDISGTAYYPSYLNLLNGVNRGVLVGDRLSLA
jgi:hypothetical protein